jgi:hypothetical protein
MRIAWQLIDSSATPEIYSFPVNPKEDSGSFEITKNPLYSSAAGPGGNTVMFEGVDQNPKVIYRGSVLTQSEYDELQRWVAKDHPVTLIDDLARESLVYLERIEFERVRSRHYPWKHTYTLEGYVL